MLLITSNNNHCVLFCLTVCFILFLLLVLLIFYRFIYPQLSLLQLTLLAADLRVMALLLTWNNNRICCFAVHFTAMPTLVSGWHLNELRGRVRRSTATLLQQGPSQSGIQVILLQHHLVALVGEQCRTEALGRYTNEHTLSDFMVVTFWTNILINALILEMLLFDRLMVGEQVFLSSVIFVQSGFSVASCAFFLLFNGLLHRDADVLQRAQLALRSSSHLKVSPFKVKLMAVYERVHTTTQFYFTIGPFGVVSKMGFFQVL